MPIWLCRNVLYFSKFLVKFIKDLKWSQFQRLIIAIVTHSFIIQMIPFPKPLVRGKEKHMNRFLLWSSVDTKVLGSYLDSQKLRTDPGSRLIESAAYCNQILLAPLCINSTQNTSVNWIIRLLLSFLYQPKVILLSGEHCIWNKQPFTTGKKLNMTSFFSTQNRKSQTYS